MAIITVNWSKQESLMDDEAIECKLSTSKTFTESQNISPKKVVNYKGKGSFCTVMAETSLTKWSKLALSVKNQMDSMLPYMSTEDSASLQWDSCPKHITWV